ncbi:MAG: hypothetical protein QF561_07570 [Phycisphaerales bacterium]|jgi:uncharacterized Zn finger protein|nr:hypothetical protein [Phycisphaerales bacterium]
MSRADLSSKAPRPSRRRGGRVRLKIEEQQLRDAPVSSIWLKTIESIVGAKSMHDGLLAAKDGAVRSLRVDRGEIAGPVQADAETSLPVAIELPTIDEAGWQRLVEAMACEAIWAAKLLEGEIPAGLGDLFRGCGTPLLPDPEHIKTHVERGGRRDVWRVAALGWIASERFFRDPLAVLAVRGMPCGDLVERISHHRALRTQGETVAHPPVVLDSAVASGPPLADCLEIWWRPHSHVHELERASHASHALLRRLGPSTLEGKFPLSGLLATIYDEAAAEAARLLDAPLGDEDASG